MSQFITIKTFASRIDAECAKNMLESNGIAVNIQADDQGGLRPDLALNLGVHLQVLAKDTDDAKALLE